MQLTFKRPTHHPQGFAAHGFLHAETLRDVGLLVKLVEQFNAVLVPPFKEFPCRVKDVLLLHKRLGSL